MSTNSFNICPSCIYRKSCVLTSQKEKVWSCSEFEEQQVTESILESVSQMNSELNLV